MNHIVINVRRPLFARFAAVGESFAGPGHQVEFAQPRDGGSNQLVDLHFINRGIGSPVGPFDTQLKLGDGPWIGAKTKNPPRYNGFAIFRRLLKVAATNKDRHTYAKFAIPKKAA